MELRKDKERRKNCGEGWQFCFNKTLFTELILFSLMEIFFQVLKILKRLRIFSLIKFVILLLKNFFYKINIHLKMCFYFFSNIQKIKNIKFEIWFKLSIVKMYFINITKKKIQVIKFNIYQNLLQVKVLKIIFFIYHKLIQVFCVIILFRLITFLKIVLIQGNNFSNIIFSIFIYQNQKNFLNIKSLVISLARASIRCYF